MFSLATEKFQEFFGLNDGKEDYQSYPQEEPAVKTTATSNSRVNHSYFQKESRADTTNQRPAAPVARQEQVVQPDLRSEVQPTPTRSQENIRMPQKVVQMTKNRVQEDTAVEKPVKKVSILEPRTYTESKNIAKCIFRNEVVIVNFHLVEEAQARRIVDFLTGCVYALDGDIQRLGAEIFICTPPNTEIDSATAKSLLSTQFNDF